MSFKLENFNFEMKKGEFAYIIGETGSGKSSILNYLHKTLKNPVDLEPVDSWQVYLNNIYNSMFLLVFNKYTTSTAVVTI